jgi:hypothetical protein
LRSRASGSEAARPSTSTISAGQGVAAWDRSPISQNSMPRSFCSGATERISATTAAAPAATMTPVSSRRVWVQLPSPRRQAEHQQHRAQGAGEGAAVHHQQGQAEQHRQQRTHRRAAGDAQHVGIGQRVAQQHLHQGAGQRQQSAAGKGRQRARQAQVAHHFGRHAFAVAEERSQYVAGGHLE